MTKAGREPVIQGSEASPSWPQPTGAWTCGAYLVTSIDDVAGELEALGLDEDEARLYLALVEGGPSRASTVASLTGFSRGKTYRLLDEMAEEGVISVALGHPRVYRARPPEELLETARQDLARERERIGEIEDRLVPAIQALAADAEEGAGPEWVVIEGRLALLRAAIKLIESAEEEIAFLGTQPLLATDAPMGRALLRALSARAGQGLRVRCLLDAELREGVSEHLGDPVERRWPKDPGATQLLVVDRREVLQWLIVDPSQRMALDGEAGVQSNATGLVAPAVRLFDLAWSALAEGGARTGPSPES